MRPFVLDSIVCFACDHETNGTNYTILGEKNLSSIKEDSVDKELSVELDDAYSYCFDDFMSSSKSLKFEVKV